MDISKKPRYNLNHVVQETSVKADSIRAWERRYQLPQPSRSEGGHRLFSDFDIATIKWLKSRKQDGLRISQAVGLWKELDLSGINPLSYPGLQSNKTLDLQINSGEPQTVIDLQQAWIDACLILDSSSADRILDQSFSVFPLATVCTDIIHPALINIGQLWYEGKISVQQEHFASEIAIKKIESLISIAPIPSHDQKILVGCPQSEQHTISALMITLLLRYRGWDVLYLGANIPIDQLLDTVMNSNPSLVILTAARLSTAATLFSSIQVLASEGFPVLYGGRIFSEISNLNNLLPGYYLQEKLTDAIPQIEYLLFNPNRISSNPIDQNQLLDTLQSFKQKETLVQLSSLQNFKEKHHNHYLSPVIQEAGAHLTKDIKSALLLGDLDLLATNLDWVKGLIGNKLDKMDDLHDYLLTYRDAVIEHLAEDGRPIVEWLDTHKVIMDGIEH